MKLQDEHHDLYTTYYLGEDVMDGACRIHRRDEETLWKI
jgi:hypothetical protein